LVEKLFQGIVVIVGSVVRAAHDRNDDVGIGPNLLVANWGLEALGVIIYPTLKVDWFPLAKH
jgi:hypothetical protein